METFNIRKRPSELGHLCFEQSQPVDLELVVSINLPKASFHVLRLNIRLQCYRRWGVAGKCHAEPDSKVSHLVAVKT